MKIMLQITLQHTTNLNIASAAMYVPDVCVCVCVCVCVLQVSHRVSLSDSQCAVNNRPVPDPSS